MIILPYVFDNSKKLLMEFATSISLRLPSKGNGGRHGIGAPMASINLFLKEASAQRIMLFNLETSVVAL